MKRWFCLFLVLAAYSTAPRPSDAQVSGTVFGETDDPIDLVEVELWGESGRLAARLTNPAGSFEFSGAEVQDAISISFNRIGFAPLRVTIDSVPWRREITLHYEPVALSPVTVASRQNLCPVSDDPAARALWESARSRYSQETAARGVAMRLMFREEQQIPIERVGVFDESRLVYRDHSRTGATWEGSWGRHVNINALIAQNGYAQPASLRNQRWNFYSIEASHAYHFASPTFGERHSFDQMDWDGSQTALIFCPTSNRGPEIEGIILISADTTFQSARWQVRTPTERVHGGGEVVFTQPSAAPGELPHLLASRGIFWLEEANFPGRYYQRTSKFLGWNVGNDDEIPPLP